MRVLVQRSNEASVKVDNKIIGKIKKRFYLCMQKQEYGYGRGSKRVFGTVQYQDTGVWNPFSGRSTEEPGDFTAVGNQSLAARGDCEEPASSRLCGGPCSRCAEQGGRDVGFRQGCEGTGGVHQDNAGL